MTNTMLRLNANEGRPCLPPAAIAALIDSETLRRYPESKGLEALMAERRGLPPERVLATAGADDAIDRAIRSFGAAGACVLSTAPAFEEYAAAAARSGSRYVCVPRAPDGPLPLADLIKAIAKERPALVVVASPDSPGGGAMSLGELRELAESAREAGATVLFDVAYADFDEEGDIYVEALGLPGVVSTGTFSKAYGLAGLRAGWAAGPADAIARMREAGPPFSLCTFSVAAARAALLSGEAAKEAFVAEVRRERPLLQAALAAMGAKTWPSRANFVTAYVPEAGTFAEKLLAGGVKIRSWLGKPGRDGMIRITCPGDEAEFRTLLEALESIGRLA
jgi:histidinol-phosphate/aromatic aminotransferase/cobyric acid decarboxylase-like protein